MTFPDLRINATDFLVIHLTVVALTYYTITIRHAPALALCLSLWLGVGILRLWSAYHGA